MQRYYSFIATLGFIGVALSFGGCGSGTSAGEERPGGGARGGATFELLNVSYDPTRELWRDINDHFIPNYERDSGNRLSIKQSHGGSSTQARAVIDGLEADVVTLASVLDTDAIRKKGLIADNWADRLPDRSLP